MLHEFCYSHFVAGVSERGTQGTDHAPAPASPKGLGSRPPSRLSFPQKRESIFSGYVTPHGSWIPACAGMTESKREFLYLRGDWDRARPCGCHSRKSGNPSSWDTSHLRLLDSCLRRNDRVETRVPVSPRGLGSRPGVIPGAMPTFAWACRNPRSSARNAPRPCPRSRGHVFSTPGTCLRKRKHGTQAFKTVKAVKTVK